jgi:tetratricopeptide (TPR) repeat protein/predicted Ser/Thr protein kinase
MEPIESIGPYQVLRRLGAGGMGEVYLAEDPRLGRQVAIKRPSEAWLRTPEGRERLRREARAAARLSHPNIAAVYDVLDIDDRPHIVMEYVEGRTLGEIIAQGPMAPQRAIEVGIQLMDALADAHLHGVIHRDLKPRNVIVTPANRVKVLDFGLAQMEEPVEATPGSGSGSGGGAITETGRVMGTPGYMAPEQLMGHRADERTDLYSAGIVLYELVTGRTVRAETDPMGRALAAVASDPPRVDSVTPSVPAQLAEIIAKAIARDPTRRYQHAGELRNALIRAQTALTDAPTVVNPWSGPVGGRARRRGAIVLAAVAVVVIVAAATYRLWWPGSGFPAGPRTVAVLPFIVDPQDANLVAVSVGLREVIVNTLAATEGVRAIPWSTDERTPDPSADVQQIARTRRAGFALTGGLGRVAGGIALTLRLTSAGSGAVWKKTYQSPPDGVVSSTYQALSDLASELRVPLLAVRPAPSWQAFQQYAQARSLLERRDVAPDNVDKAIEMLESVTSSQREFALGFAALGEAYWQKFRTSKDPSLPAKASQATLNALSLDPAQPLVRLALATILAGTGDTKRAEEELRAVIKKNPMDAAHRSLGTILSQRGNVDEGLAELQRAIDMRPDVILNYRTKASALLNAGRYPDAEKVLRSAADLQPDHAGVHQQLGTTYQLMGEVEKAIAEFRRSLDLAPSATSWSNLGTLLQDSGKKAEALDAFEHAVKMSERDPRIRRNLGDVLQQLGRIPDARAEFERCATLSDEALKVNPRAAETHGMLGVCQAKLGRFKEAIAAANQGVVLAPGSSDAYHRLAAVLALAKKPAEAVAALEKGIANGLGAGLVRRDDDLASLRQRPDYQALVAKAR